ncbi:hypothetical protein QMT04_19000 [Cronobacter sakazakii]|uniref:hypothetical protein n=1 Tax=Cronobacter sakazakii TaxID=28141 RepID=UPI0005779276|nr:hypothetical protein [Cronobacter sakazakii]AXW98437.2 hypothetical protein CsakCS931_30675 [Cronobacter sakazakii]EIZ9238246.1 hypothetical protein [Cronobacter sakazakii]ELY2935925.1 hypothetical protein [Cronobacter sakazakii]ELY4184559.1 hypothetical protein [Cronobacter sakazakii]ELY4315690.1 hypothetical protein [Cronobacter sakazakii]
MCVLNERKKLIISLMRKEIDYCEFSEAFKAKYDDIDVCKELRLAYDLKDGQYVDLLLYVAAVIKFEFVCIDLLNDLITSDWHQKHEELARLLQIYKSEKSVESLYKAALLHLDYRDYDEDFILADKCIRALAQINNSDAVEKLKLLYNEKNQYISNSAKKQLTKLGLFS